MDQITERASPVRGVVITIANPRGGIIATGTDFDLQAPGGFNLFDAQRRRAKTLAVMAFSKAMLFHEMTEKLDLNFAEILWGQAKINGYRMIIVPVGHPDREIEVVNA